ncbi:MAG TPA: nicotinate-nucleotide adenylyltransferase [Candidatus Hydrothermia bacterium]|nr:nicotinate-nucleotide adenylyltransferase [Candidatus Hydrothermia bacterium]HOK22631.1 nicotinate-nucleotide adenylyltransferase [Candidatus Hydrothermia bacterium]HOL23340.1 nicotinate-nucleotide adenylyltransferase [Candidatus Hydrothermia bacterium]HOP32532.1 nicotinate-nucleotide adenylyltransferase [Candidatus Hydrothermia bacterium]HPO78477.1 nicotinate-nucleotide adenylyltransferase [Candidatus Hydrothermia bacterium]
MPRVGIFGGAFDPVHTGHLILAQDVWDNVRLDKIVFLVNYEPPHKGVYACFEDRFQMVKLALKGMSNFEASDFEATRHISPSYTVNVLNEMKRENPESEFFLIIGTDQFNSLHTWYRADLLLSMVKLIVLRRPGWQPPQEVYSQVVFVDERLIDISSTEIRDRVRKGKSIKYLVPYEVEEYILKNRIYL